MVRIFHGQRCPEQLTVALVGLITSALRGRTAGRCAALPQGLLSNPDSAPYGEAGDQEQHLQQAVGRKQVQRLMNRMECRTDREDTGRRSWAGEDLTFA